MRRISVILTCLLLGPALAPAGQELSPQQQAEARKIYVAKCAKCHRFYEPRNYDERAWQTWMESMSRKSKLKPQQETLLNQYLDSYRAGHLGRKPEAR